MLNFLFLLLASSLDKKDTKGEDPRMPPWFNTFHYSFFSPCPQPACAMNLLSPYFCASICLMALCFLQVALQIEAFSIDHIRRASTAASVCSSLTPATKVNYPASVAYIAFLVRFMSSSTQTPVCVFQPSVPADLSNAMKLIGQSGVPFAVSSGRHASNQGFSSTTGVQIDLSNFSNVTLSSDKSYVDVGAGNLWDNVYKVLDQSGVNIVGGRVAGVGVGGYITGGGGYSWKTNQVII